MTAYTRLTVLEREQIKSGLLIGKNQTIIARDLGRTKSTISRELKRLGIPQKQYSPFQANVDSKQKRSACKAGKKKIKDVLANTIEDLLRNKRFSPEQISQVLRKQHPNNPLMQASHETIYQYIYSQQKGEKRNQLIQCLRRRKKSRRRRSRKNEKRGIIRNMTSIHDRSEAANKREEVGHWEGDLVVGKNHKTAILTLVERVSRYTIIVPLGMNLTSEAVIQACKQEFGLLPPQLRKSLTYDRGKEMALHESLTNLTGVKVYFADPHSPWQRGTNENTNGLIRDFFPKGTDFSLYKLEQFKAVETLLNIRPRKILQFETPDSLMKMYLGPLEEVERLSGYC